MFLTGIFSGAGLNALDPEQERDPPAAATPLTFPAPEVYSQSAWNDESPPPKLRPLFSRILKPTDISGSHVEALNIKMATACLPDDLLPRAPDGTSYIPPLTSSHAINSASYADAAKVDGALAKKRKEFDDRLTELRIDNDTGYRIINRTLKPDEKPPRLAYMRKFWEGLETMSPYWDTSLDQYYEGPPPTPAAPESLEKGFKRQRLDSAQPNNLTVPIIDSAAEPGTSSQEPKADDVQAVASHTPLPEERQARSTSATPEERTCLRYKGRRTASGRDMPDQFRADTVRAFVESVIWAFHCAVAVPRQMPIVQMNKLNLPVRQSAAVYRVPQERAKARSGCVIGPAMTIQVRPETDFDAAGIPEQQRINKARLDLMRELGGLLQCAQERNRQGKTESRPGEGKWWTEKPRWGGGPGGEVENQEGNSDTQVKDVLQMAEEMIGSAREKMTASKPRRSRKTPAMLWKELKCGSRLWDPKTEYEAIGKDPASEYDEVFMVSSLNHHISILKLTVHTAYTEYVRTEEVPDPLPQDLEWCSPRLQRTQWYDLFDVEDRVQAFTALWGIISYLTRETSTSGKAAGGAVGAEGGKES